MEKKPASVVSIASPAPSAPDPNIEVLLSETTALLPKLQSLVIVGRCRDGDVLTGYHVSDPTYSVRGALQSVLFQISYEQDYVE